MSTSRLTNPETCWVRMIRIPAKYTVLAASMVNSTNVFTFRPDIWVLPFVNIYGILGTGYQFNKQWILRCELGTFGSYRSSCST